MSADNLLLPPLLVVATAVGSLAGSFFGFILSSRLAERQLRYSQRVDAVFQLLGLLYQLQRDLRSRANREELNVSNKGARTEDVRAKLNQLASYRILYSPWLSPVAYTKLEELNRSMSRHHAELANALTVNVMNDPSHPRAVQAVENLQRWLQHDMPPLLEELEDEFRMMIGTENR